MDEFLRDIHTLLFKEWILIQSIEGCDIKEESKKIILGGSEHDGCTLTQPYTYTKTAMITLTRIFKTNNYVFKKLCRPPPVKDCFFFFHIYSQEVPLWTII